MLMHSSIQKPTTWKWLITTVDEYMYFFKAQVKAKK